MYKAVIGLIFLTGIFPFWAAWKANRTTTLQHALVWAFADWLLWGCIIWIEVIQAEPTPIGLRYLAMSLVGCAGVAVLGARRPGVLAWNFVVAALLGVMLFLLMESRLGVDDRILKRLKIIGLSCGVALGVLNYLPTRLAPAGVLLALSCALEISQLARADSLDALLAPASPITRLAWALVPWAAYAGIRWPVSPVSDFNQRWLGFRDRFGLVWAQRLREQFNQAAKHSRWPVVLSWQGLRLVRGAPDLSSAAQQEMLDTLRALMKRFGTEETVGKL